MEDKKRDDGDFRVSAAVTTAVPTTVARPALETILKEFAAHAGSTSLALDIPQLRLPFETVISVPIEVRVGSGKSRNEWQLIIRAAAKVNIYPTFAGVLTLQPSARSGSQIELDGTYAVPFGAFGRAVDAALLHHVAQSSMRRFVRELANRTVALSRWAHLA